MPLEFCVDCRIFVYLSNKINFTKRTSWMVNFEVSLDFNQFQCSKGNIKYVFILFFRKN